MVISASPVATAARILVRATVFAITIAVRRPRVALKHANAKRCRARLLAPAAVGEFHLGAEAYPCDWPSANQAAELQLNLVTGADPAFHQALNVN